MSSPDFSSLISGILSNPEMLSGIMNAVSTLGSSGLGSVLQNTQKGSENNSAATSVEADQSIQADPPQKPILEAFASDHQSKDGSLVSTHNNSADRRALLYALKPFLGEKRGEKIDFILKVLALLDAAEGFNKFK